MVHALQDVGAAERLDHTIAGAEANGALDILDRQPATDHQDRTWRLFAASLTERLLVVTPLMIVVREMNREEPRRSYAPVCTVWFLPTGACAGLSRS